MKTKLVNNLLLKILSVLAAILLWLIVVNIDDAVTSKQIRNVKVSMLNTNVLTEQGQMCRVEDGTDVVDLTVYARRSVLDKLKASDFSATADLKKDLRYDSMVKIDVAYTGSQKSTDIQKIELSRTNVLVKIEESVTEQFKVNVRTNGEASDGLTIGSKIPEQTLIEVTGPISVVNRIKKVEVEVEATGITGTSVRTGKLELLDADNNPIDGTYLDYYGKDSDFEVTLTVLKTKLVGISFDISTAAPEGYALSAISYKPETVTIAGEKSQISPIYNLSIPPEALNPDRETGTVKQTVDISQYLDDGIIIPKEEEREIVVTMDILPLLTETYPIGPDQIEYLNMPEGLELDISEMPALDVPVSALESALAGLTADQISVSVDLSGYSRSGTYAVPATVTVPENYQVPDDLEITLKLVRDKEET